MSERIVALQEKLKSFAFFLAPGSPLDQDDLLQSMNLRILERSKYHKTLWEQTDSYILQDAYMNGGRRQVRKSQIYLSYVDAETFLEDENGDEFSVFELIPSDYNVENDVILSEQIEAIETAVKSLSESNQIVFWMLVDGADESEIAKNLGVSRSAISQRKSTIARNLLPALT